MTLWQEVQVALAAVVLAAVLMLAVVALGWLVVATMTPVRAQ